MDANRHDTPWLSNTHCLAFQGMSFCQSLAMIES
jgi:hypothetical protein